MTTERITGTEEVGQMEKIEIPENTRRLGNYSDKTLSALFNPRPTRKAICFQC